MSQKDSKRAIDSYTKALAAQPGLTEAQIALGAALLQSGDAEASEAAYRKVIAEQPNNADAYFNLGNALFTKRQLRPAADAYRESIRLRPDSPARTTISQSACSGSTTKRRPRNSKKPRASTQPQTPEIVSLAKTRSTLCALLHLRPAVF